MSMEDHEGDNFEMVVPSQNLHDMFPDSKLPPFQLPLDYAGQQKNIAEFHITDNLVRLL